jgi:hypothetical protein
MVGLALVMVEALLEVKILMEGLQGLGLDWLYGDSTLTATNLKLNEQEFERDSVDLMCSSTVLKVLILRFAQLS